MVKIEVGRYKRDWGLKKQGEECTVFIIGDYGEDYGSRFSV